MGLFVAALELKKDDPEDLLLVSEGGEALAVGSIITVLVLLDDTLNGTAEDGNGVLEFAMPLLDIVEVGNQDMAVSSKGKVVLLTVIKVVDGWTRVVDEPVTVTNPVLVVTT